MTEETIAEELIETIGIGGNFLGRSIPQDTSARTCISQSSLIVRHGRHWLPGGAKDTLPQAHRTSRRMTAKYTDRPGLHSAAIRGPESDCELRAGRSASPNSEGAPSYWYEGGWEEAPFTRRAAT